MTTSAVEIPLDLQTQINKVTERYRPALAELAARGKKIGDEYQKPNAAAAKIGFDFDVNWKRLDMSFDLPSVTMKTISISADVPEVTNEPQTIIFHTPSTRMVTREVGRKPEVRNWTIEWTPIYMDFPELFMEEQKIIFDLPSVRMKRQDWKIDIPHFTMQRQEISIDVPDFKLRNVTAETEKLKASGAELQAEGDQLARRMKADINAVISTGSAMAAQGTTGATFEISRQFDSAIAALSKAVAELAAKGVDPIKVPSEKGDVNLRKQLSELIAQRDAALAAATSTANASVPKGDDAAAMAAETPSVAQAPELTM